MDPGREVLRRQDRLTARAEPLENVDAFRRRVIEALVAPLRALDAVEAVWQGGSAATGRLDAFSDVDLCIVAPPAATAAVFAAVESALAAVAPIEHTWHVEPPAFRDMAQRFYLLAGAPPFFAVDCSVLAPAGVAQFLERERHGEPLVYFDRGGRVRAVPLDRSAHEARRRARLEQIGQAAPVYALLARKELARERALEALGFYQALLRALVELFGMAHRPERFDFGLRYVQSDFPPEVQQRLAHFAFVPDAHTLAARVGEIVAAIETQRAALTATGRAVP